MTSQRLGRQPDLFAPPTDLFDPRPDEEAPPADFIERIRHELHTTLALASAAEALPWTDLTTAILTEKRFHSIAGWLPDAEAAGLRAAFAAELDRLYGPDDPPAA
jgi:hypothetical protein